MNHEEALQRALDAIHAIGGAMQIRRLRDGRVLNVTMRQKLDEKALTDKQIEDLALNAWADIVENVKPRLKDTTIITCHAEVIS